MPDMSAARWWWWWRDGRERWGEGWEKVERGVGVGGRVGGGPGGGGGGVVERVQVTARETKDVVMVSALGRGTVVWNDGQPSIRGQPLSQPSSECAEVCV